MALSGIKIETLKEKYLRTFFLQYKKLSYVGTQPFEDVEIFLDTPLVKADSVYPFERANA